MKFPFYQLDFDASGQPVASLQQDYLIANSRDAGVTDLIFLAHGFRCDTAEATALYTNLLTALKPRLARMTDRKFGVAGVYWPSKEFPESLGTAESVRHNLSELFSLAAEGTNAFHYANALLRRLPKRRQAQDDFVGAVLLSFDDGGEDPSEGLPLLHEFLDLPGGGVELLDRLRVPGTTPATTDVGGICNIPLVDSVLNGVDTLLNFMTWAEMKRLSGKVGTTGLASLILACQRKLPSVRIHLVGHSLGGRLMAACCKSVAQLRGHPVDSLSLLEAAFSHFGFSPDAGWGQPGFFRDVIANQAVRGPIISTFSKQDAVVGLAYAAASRLAHDRLQAIGNSADPYGGIGHNGAQRTPESAVEALHPAGEPYSFRPGIVTCLDGSGGMITSHGDVTNPHVAYAIASTIDAAM